MNFKGKVAVVTGSAAGIGRATAIAFAQHGASVALLDVNQAGVEETAAMVRQAGGQALALRADVGVEKEVAEAFQQIAASLKQIDILINNAGVELYKDFLQFESAEWDRQLAVNLNSVYYCSKQAIPFMIRSGEGSIVNLSSVQALATTGQVAPYAAAKGGILSLTRDMAREFGKHKIRVNSICPGCIHTTMMDRTLATMPDAETVVKRMTQAIPLQRLGKAEDIAKVALFLASPYADYISRVTGGGWRTVIEVAVAGVLVMGAMINALWVTVSICDLDGGIAESVPLAPAREAVRKLKIDCFRR